VVIRHGPPVAPGPVLSIDVYDLVVIGMGSGGLTAAELAIDLGLRVALVEQARVGGDCLWSGCVPSKALLASAKAAHTMRTADRFGLTAVEPDIDLAMVWRRVRAVQAEIAATDDDPQNFRDMGAEVVIGTARLLDGEHVAVRSAEGDHELVLETRFILVCTGSRPAVPTIPGLTDANLLTSENLFTLSDPPSSIAILGGGPMGVEMAQALQRLGVDVTLFQRADSLLPRDEPTLTEQLAKILTAEGVTIHCTADVRRVDNLADGRSDVHALVGHDGEAVMVRVAAVLSATGRKPHIDALGLEDIGVAVTGEGIEVDERGRTSVRTVYAAGDVTGRRLFTNAAGYEAVQAVRDMFFPGRAGAHRVMPWCTFTDPELAHVGLTVAEAEEQHGGDTDVWRIDLDRNDRARTDAAGNGGLVAVTAKGRLVGAHVLAPSAGEMIHELAFAVARELRIDELAELPHVYPTMSSSIGRIATEAAYERARRLKWMMKRR
jgi:pyruvate/2-oxoglutarate dehydrogenase complex dihydrolipoamide dehydrogenase (E3) component